MTDNNVRSLTTLTLCLAGTSVCVVQIFGQSVERLTSLSNTWRLDILFKYGGIYVDTDAIFVQHLSKELRAYDVVLSYDWIDWYRPFPDIINNGIMVSKPGARFLELWLVLYIYSQCCQ